MAYNGAESISEEMDHGFFYALESYELKETLMYLVFYGLAEASLSVSFSKLKNKVFTQY
jgi:hypothetical protein